MLIGFPLARLKTELTGLFIAFRTNLAISRVSIKSCCLDPSPHKVIFLSSLALEINRLNTKSGFNPFPIGDDNLTILVFSSFLKSFSPENLALK